MDMVKDYDDRLILLCFSKESKLINTFFCACGEGFSDQNFSLNQIENSGNYQLYVSNKYFTSNILVEVEVIDSCKFEIPQNYILLIETVEEFEDERNKKYLGELLGESESKLKLVVCESKLAGRIDFESKYDLYKAFFPVYFLNSDEKTDRETLVEIKEILQNNLWNHSKNNTKKAEVGSPAGKENDFEDYDEIFEQILNFKKLSKDFSPNSRKNQASTLILNLVDKIDLDQIQE